MKLPCIHNTTRNVQENPFIVTQLERKWSSTHPLKRKLWLAKGVTFRRFTNRKSNRSQEMRKRMEIWSTNENCCSFCEAAQRLPRYDCCSKSLPVCLRAFLQFMPSFMPNDLIFAARTTNDSNVQAVDIRIIWSSALCSRS